MFLLLFSWLVCSVTFCIDSSLHIYSLSVSNLVIANPKLWLSVCFAFSCLSVYILLSSLVLFCLFGWFF